MPRREPTKNPVAPPSPGARSAPASRARSRGAVPDDAAAAEFAAACDQAGVDPADREALRRLHARWRPRPGSQGPLEELLADYGHWRLYLRGRTGEEDASDRFRAYWKRYLGAYLAGRFAEGEAEEVEALFFARVWRLVGTRFDWNCPFTVYLRAVVVNLTRDRVRLVIERRRREVSLDAAESAVLRLPAQELSPERRLLVEERREVVRRALETLSPGDRHIVRACLVEGESGQDVAAALGIKRDALYQRLNRAKKRLRALLAGEGPLSDSGKGGV